MHPYLPVLIDDIKAAQLHESNIPQKITIATFAEEMERFANSEVEKPLSYYTGLQIENFPPPEIFSEEDMKITLEAFDEMLETWNAGIDYPESMPVEKRYAFLRKNVLENDFTPMNAGFVIYDFCAGCAPECEWEEYCNCLK
ncbi:hypothetical protein [Chryseobacterium koreense]|uniref:Uncharacterized protein n=1 Tax=Chryseobacterium koreense CCUG 49689 TaxID=1304281 RepID=A0A0J7IZ46_9FLAO|nr:hypothetical protein [Chryseobacterium koreense]KMQ71513.1 hypothetical protein ACM44_06720 [Chryseobacterium koreense CCUG 49689]MBB5333783.1 hypothetical protein [Chryseobacterium koreense]